MRNLLLFAFSLAVVACAPPVAEPPPEVTVTLTRDGGQVTSPDGNFVMVVPGQSLISDTDFTVVQRPAADSFNPDVTLSNVYEVTANDDVAIVFRAQLSFQVSRGEIDRLGLENVGVGHGEVVGERYDEILAGSYDDEAGAYVADTVSLSWFALVEIEDEVPVCACDETPGCDADCGCDPVCGPVEPGSCDESCMSNSGAVCCEQCGQCNAVEIACEPVCPDGSGWDCELLCCFDSAETVCVN